MTSLSESSCIEDVSERMISMVISLCTLSYDLDGIELNNYAEIAGVELDDPSTLVTLVEAYHSGALGLKEDALTRPIIYTDVEVSDAWLEYAALISRFRSSFYGREEGKKRVKEMRIGRVKCGICGMFSVTNFDEVEVMWPKFSKQPHAKARCTTCGRFVISKIGTETALFFESAGVRTSHWSEGAFDEKDIKRFVSEMDDEIRFLLS